MECDKKFKDAIEKNKINIAFESKGFIYYYMYKNIFFLEKKTYTYTHIYTQKNSNESSKLHLRSKIFRFLNKTKENTKEKNKLKHIKYA